MTAATGAEANRSPMIWVGWALSGLTIAFMLFDSIIKLLDLGVVKTTMVQLGYPIRLDRPIGVIELASIILYAVPRTSVLGAILLTAIFGGAIASHMRLGDPLFGFVLFGAYLGLFAWGGLWLRDPRLRSLMPIRRP